MPLTAAEWLSENSERQELAVMNIPLAMELYAKYVSSFAPKDVVEAINEKYPADMQTKSKVSMGNGLFAITLQQAANYGYSLAAGESVEFLGWIVDNSYMRCNPEGYWIKVGSENRFSASQLFELFKKESNG